VGIRAVGEAAAGVPDQAIPAVRLQEVTVAAARLRIAAVAEAAAMAVGEEGKS